MCDTISVRSKKRTVILAIVVCYLITDDNTLHACMDIVAFITGEIPGMIPRFSSHQVVVFPCGSRNHAVCVIQYQYSIISMYYGVQTFLTVSSNPAFTT